MTDPHIIDSHEQLSALYPAPSTKSRAKVHSCLTDEMLQWLTHSPFFVLASQQNDGIDCSPRGDLPGKAFWIRDRDTIAIPDRRGNNRVDTLRNIILDPRVGLVFMIPGIEQALRIKGHARISVEPTLLSELSLEGQAPATVLLISISTAYLQNARAVRSADLWNAQKFTNTDQLPDTDSLLRPS